MLPGRRGRALSAPVVRCALYAMRISMGTLTAFFQRFTAKSVCYDQAFDHSIFSGE
jgi:hypothetical protein